LRLNLEKKHWSKDQLESGEGMGVVTRTKKSLFRGKNTGWHH